ncbi:tyrosine-type recombinase/integrase [Bradyrhizobium cenepequi]|uniref:tyrosine-type recombinase/integrase n=1 Tax=Bradyrhizobium cenepequi TaxID=2821403 RepID=UPI001CE268BB|nr:integrase family protein [Bradyrhizobium cenepequi]MCA6106117.1 integrase family protein [Bradyrhizobium cenepequi]
MSEETSNGRRPKERRKQRFSDTWIARHKQTLPQEDWFDTGFPDLILRMSYGGARTFRVRYGNKGEKKRTYKLGRWDPKEFSVEAARKAAKLFKPAEPEPGSNEPKSDEEAWWHTATMEQVIERYIKEVVSTFRTKDEVTRCYRRYVIPKLGKKRFLDLKKSDAAGLRLSMRTEHGNRQADIVFGLVRTLLFWVEDEGLCEGYESSIRYQSKRRGKKKRTRDYRVLDDDELRMVWRAAEQMGGLYGGLVRLLLLTAQRRQCLATARWDEIMGGTWHIREEEGAKGTGQILRLPPLALKILESLPRIKGNPYVFGIEHNGEHKPFNSFSQRKAELEALLPRPFKDKWTLHDLRRTARTRMEDIGVDMQVGEVTIGHALPGVKRIYIRSKFKEKRADALLRLSEHIAEIVGLSPDRGTPSGPAPSNVVSLTRSRRA